LVIEGPAGIGKTALLDRTCDLAEEAGFLVLRARGGELEREFPHGVVRQLLEGHVRGRSAKARSSLLSGAAELAAPVVAPDAAREGDRPAGDSSFAVTHGLYWLTANLADETPLLLAVDDIQWSDAASLRFVAHLARRLEGIAVLLAVCIRTGEPAVPEEVLSRLSAEPSANVLHPAPLSEVAVSQIIETRLSEEPAPAFTQACLRATGGTPFLLGELMGALDAREVRPTGDSVREVGDVGPRAVARAILLRFGRLPPGAAELARAVAVLGVDARLYRAARLADVEEPQAVEAVAALETMDILRPRRPLEFVHPIVRGAIYDDMPAATRSAAHTRAADLLADEDEDADAIATHLLLTEPGGRGDTVRRLRDAADRAVARGAPESAATYLRRALEEGAGDAEDRATLSLQLGRAERILRPAVAVEHYRDAHELAVDPAQRARIVYELVNTQFYLGRWDEAFALLESVIAEVEVSDRELALRLEALRAYHEFLGADTIGAALHRLPKLRALAGDDTPGERVMAVLVAGIAAWLGEPVEEIRRLVDLGLRDGRLPAEEGAESWLVTLALGALALIEDLDLALVVRETEGDDARRRGSTVGIGVTSGMGVWIHSRRGDLVSAEADVRATLQMIRENRFELGEVPGFWHAIDVLTERSELEDEARRVLALEIDDDFEARLPWPLTMAFEARGRVRLAFGEVGGAVDDLNRCAKTVHGHGNPNGWGWRPALALALAPSEPNRALELAHEHLRATRHIGMPRGIGIGLRTLGLVEDGEQGLAHLEEAVHVLRASPARLEHARALVELGAARRRAGQRADAREPLREGLDLAHRCGATRLEDRARQELTATGARPRRAMLTGRDALTATEQRIAGMAAEGMSNPEIAQALFVTRKNVENHLGRIYPKLEINSRTQLADALGRHRREE
jgi:DNA-binding CsgD family transcriptional regulator